MNNNNAYYQRQKQGLLEQGKSVTIIKVVKNKQKNTMIH